MSRSTFSGPVLVGVDDSSFTETGTAKTGPNWGFLKMAQSAPIAEVGASKVFYPTFTDKMTMVIPANSTITRISVLVITAWTASTKSVSVGQLWGTIGSVDTDVDDLVADMVLTSLGMVVAGPGDTDDLSAGDINNWMNNSVRQSPPAPPDRCITVKSPSSGDGVGVLTVEYCQAVNLEAIA